MTFQTPKGTRDFLPEEMAIRRQVLETITSVYRLFGFREWDGPAFEYLETLTRKSGESIAQEIYTFKDKGGRQLGLRFELTASVARIVANNPNLKKPIKLYNIGKVWRYEQPQAGRYREFFQADTDIFGSAQMASEVDLLLMATFALEKLSLGEYTVLLNNRKILESQLRSAGISEGQQTDAVRALDKLAKIGEEGVSAEFSSRGIPLDKFEALMKFIQVPGDNIEKLEKTRELLKADERGIEGVAELQEILALLKEAGFKGAIEVDFSLVRGLDYYTGPIFEIHSSSERGLGSFAGGGRYDNLVELFGGPATPAVGISFGIERLIEIIKERSAAVEASPEVKVFVAFTSAELLPEVIKITQRLRQTGIPAEYDLLGRNLGKQLAYVNSANIPFSLIVSEKETKLKEMSSGEESILPLDQLITRLSSN